MLIKNKINYILNELCYIIEGDCHCEPRVN